MSNPILEMEHYFFRTFVHEQQSDRKHLIYENEIQSNILFRPANTTDTIMR